MAVISYYGAIDIILYIHTVLYRHVIDINSIISLSIWLYNGEKDLAEVVLEWMR